MIPLICTFSWLQLTEHPQIMIEYSVYQLVPIRFFPIAHPPIQKPALSPPAATAYAPSPMPIPAKAADRWSTVGVFSKTTQTVSDFIAHDEWNRAAAEQLFAQATAATTTTTTTTVVHNDDGTVTTKTHAAAGTIITADSLPDLSRCVRVPLEPGTAYRFRVTAINNCGMGEAGEVSDESIDAYFQLCNA